MKEEIHKIHKVINEVLAEDGGTRHGGNPRVRIVENIGIEREDPIGYGNNKETTIYVRNYGQYYCMKIVPVSWLGFTPKPAYSRELPDCEAGITPVFLCKQARKDAEQSLHIQRLNPGKYITKASSQRKGRIAAYQMKQGIVYVDKCSVVPKDVYLFFFETGKLRMK